MNEAVFFETVQPSIQRFFAQEPKCHGKIPLSRNSPGRQAKGATTPHFRLWRKLLRHAPWVAVAPGFAAAARRPKRPC
jgi:hypothetical protein